MPMITVQLAADDRPALVSDVARAVGAVTARVLRKDPEVTVIAVELFARERWFVGGTSLTELGVGGFYVEIRVTEGTNTKDEKARYVAEMFNELQALIGAVHQSSYVLVADTKADGYGYAGRTQESRYVEKAFAVSPR